MKNIFNKTFNKLLIEETEKIDKPIDPKTLDDARIKKLLNYHVDLSGKKNSKDKNFKTNLDKFNLTINGVRYQSILDEINELEQFNKLYPEVDKSKCKAWHLTNIQQSSKEFQQNQHNPKWIRSIGKAINKFIEFEENFENAMDKATNIKAVGHITNSINASKEDLTISKLDQVFIIFYVDDNNIILKPANIDDDKYKKMCQTISNISIGLKNNQSISQGIQKLKTIDGKTIGVIAKNILKKKVTEKAKEDKSLSTKFKTILKDTFKLYKVACKSTFQDFIVTVETRPWGRDILDNVIKIGNDQIKSGEIKYVFPTVEFIFGKTISAKSEQTTNLSS